ncbi:MAG: phosphatase PAP2 family protein [Sphingomonadales bacterium]|nr:MAG: phosphatase PAP2 family protein [Sphingomonadales bacterium]
MAQLDPPDTERPTSRRVPWPIAWAAAGAAFLLLLIWFGRAASTGSGFEFDRAIMLAMRVPGHPDTPTGPAWLPSAVRDVTALGSSIVLTAVVVVTATFLGLRRRMRSVALVLLATISGSLAVTLIKALVGRSRPDLIDRLMVEASHSFPSGHAANSAIVYLTLATLLLPILQEREMRRFVIVVALLLTGVIGISRVYLGVHWPSDVLAGWVFGSGWAIAWWRLELKLLDGRSASETHETTWN